jgi:nitroreductase
VLKKAFAYRRSFREYRDEALTLEQSSQLLGTTYGATETHYGYRTTPSAGATYPLKIYVAVKPHGVKTSETEYLEPGLYKYSPHKYSLIMVKKGDFSRNPH